MNQWIFWRTLFTKESANTIWIIEKSKGRCQVSSFDKFVIKLYVSVHDTLRDIITKLIEKKLIFVEKNIYKCRN